MDLSQHKITQEERTTLGVVALADRPEMPAQTLKECFDALTNKVADQFNATVDDMQHMEDDYNVWAAREQGRVDAESSRVTAEQGRVSAETARADAETARAAAEPVRMSAEQGRVTAEQGRAGAEAVRVQNEDARKTAEAARAAAEPVRMSAESSRVTAEQERAGAEAMRVQSEDARKTAEQGRVNAETARVDAEAARAAAEAARADFVNGSVATAKAEADRAKAEADRASAIVGGDYMTRTEVGAAVETHNSAGDAHADMRAEVAGKATLGADGKVPVEQLPEMNYEPTGTAAAAVAAHNSAGDAHADMRAEIDIVSQKIMTAELHVLVGSGITVTATLGTKSLSATAGSDGWAILYPAALGDWTLSATISGSAVTKTFTIDTVAVFYTALATPESLSWSVVSSVSEAGLAPKFWSVGDTKTLTVNGVTYTAVILGFNHDTKTAGGKAGITFQLQNCLATIYPMNSSDTNSGGWTSSVMRGTTMVTLLSQLPSTLQSAIKQVNKLSSAGSQSATINTTADKLFFLSEIEIFGAVTYSKAGEGTQYDYYKAGNSKIKTVNGSAFSWWERSANGSDATNFGIVNGTGGATAASASVSRGVSFGFCV